MTVRQRIAARVLRRRHRAAARDVPRVGVGMPAWLKLNVYGALVTGRFAAQLHGDFHNEDFVARQASPTSAE